MRVGFASRPAHRRRHVRAPLAVLSVLGLALGQVVLAATPASAVGGIAVHDIQGAAHRSPLAGQFVSDVAAVVTAVGRNGFWMQGSQPDADPATSEGIFVFTRTAPAVRVGDQVNVSGTVTEFRPGNDPNNLTTTELTSPVVTVVGGGDPPTPTLLGPGGLTPPVPVRADAPGDVEQAGFDPARHGLDRYESLEGMLVRVIDAVATGRRNQFGELSVLPGGVGEPRTVRGGVRYTYQDANTERVILDDVLATIPVADTNDRLPGPVDGVLDYSFGNYKLLVTGRPTLEPAGLLRESTTPQASNQLAVATYNVENLDPGDPATKFERLARGITEHLAAPDIIALEEVQDNSGPRNDGITAADATYTRLIDTIQAVDGPRYDYRQIDPQNLTDGGEPGGNIRVGFLFRTDRELEFVDRPGGDAATGTRPVEIDNRAALSLSPGRVDPDDPAWQDSRKPLAGEFRFRGKTFLVVANHFTSKGGDQPLMGRFQPPARDSEQKHHAQATVLRGFLDEIFTIQPDAGVVVLGDLNDFEFSRTVDILVADGSMVDLPRQLPEAERYTYVFDGNSQVLDQILISRPLTEGHAYDVVHINAEFADQASDHDPQVVRLTTRPGGKGHT
ncbi:MAG TPA: endonuclease/exonuclease/phosphatase family protein [Micromonosporaceae bacterium]|nr:endonuclease/exonuclease/phosphatase family protein [Micromonosporaceae bacterium]